MNQILIQNMLIGHGQKPFLIAEMSGNHNNSLDQAIQIVRAAASCGASAIKLQTYTADTITIDHDGNDFKISNKGSIWSGRTLYDLYEEASTNWEWNEIIIKEANANNLICFSSVFDETSVDFLEDLNVPAYKISSFENNHIPLLKKVAQTGKPIIVSTGASTENDIDEVVSTLKEARCQSFALLKCTSDYPASPEEANLLTIPQLIKKYKCPVGLSDHTMGNAVAIASVALGASIVEKHFITDRGLGGVDSMFSADIDEMRSLADDLHTVFKSLGEPKLDIGTQERENLQFKRSIYAISDIAEGVPFTRENIRVIRPGYGLHPRYYDQLIGQLAHRTFKKR